MNTNKLKNAINVELKNRTINVIKEINKSLDNCDKN